MKPRPRNVRRRVGRAVIDNVVHAAHQEAIDDLFHLAERLVEMFVEPGGRLTRHERLACHVCRPRSELEHQPVRITAHQPTKAFDLRNVAGRIQVEPVRR